MLTIVQIISTIVTTLVAIGGILGSVRTMLKERQKYREEREEKLEQDKETDRCLLRNAIKDTYFTFKHDRKWSEIEYENMEKLYKQYKQLGGNSFVDRIWTEVQEWEIDEQ